jgi:hypothetical protein
MGKLSIYKYVRTGKGWRYCKAAFHPNGKIKPNVVVVEGREEKHPEGSYFLNVVRESKQCRVRNRIALIRKDHRHSRFHFPAVLAITVAAVSIPSIWAIFSALEWVNSP